MGVNEGTVLTVDVADGRELEVVLLGPEDGVPVFAHHGTPGTTGLYRPIVAGGAERGLRHVTYARPGYAGSTRMAGRSVADCAADVAAIADALGYERFYSVGGSGGGPHSIACAALLPDRVIAAVAIATPAPFDAEGLDWTAGMGSDNIAEVAAALAGDRELQDRLEAEADKMLRATPADIAEAFGDLISEADREVVTGEYAEWLAQQCAGSLARGVWGWFDDDRALLSDWGFDLGAIGAPLAIWHGVEDRFVPVAHGRWLAERTGAHAELRPDAGHLSLALGAYDAILDDMLGLDPLRR